jgi:hypothetical protein
MKTCKKCGVEKEDDMFEKGKNQCKACRKQYHLNRAPEARAQKKEYRKNNKDKIKEYNKKYDEEHKGYRTIAQRNRRRNNLSVRLHSLISCSIYMSLKKSGGSKNGRTCLMYLDYTMNQLKSHLQSLFEPWMNWSNWGIYNHETWNDDDPLTWTWQIDHIIPKSNFPYTSMEDDNFKKCWALSNLRPYSAKQNLIDGASKTRHDTNERK